MNVSVSKKTGILMIIIGICLIIAGAWWWLSGRYHQSTDNAYIQADKITVSSKLAGFLESGWIDDNQWVKAGTELARIDESDYRNNVRKARASVDAGRAEVNTIDAQVILQQSLIRQAEAAIDADELKLKQTADDVSRYQRLSSQGYSSERELESAQVAYAAAKAELIQAKAALSSQKETLGVLESQRQQAVANVLAEKASLAKADDDLRHVVIQAPETGIVAQRLAKNGEFVGAGTPLFSLVDMSEVWVVANFKETQIHGMKVGQPVSMEVDGYPGQTIRGYIDSFSPGSGAEFSILPPQNASGNFTKIVQRIPVKILIPDDQPLNGKLRPGMSVEVSIDTRDDVLQKLPQAGYNNSGLKNSGSGNTELTSAVLR
ncbi:Multidrug export protein EmrA [invertebrate metagenome]|uniref:Multidrug export protein EmrA n=1 Tax=invertebrate metagenome TaxID=1711999 RepID=A0A2H9T3S1_9ZZZZ